MAPACSRSRPSSRNPPQSEASVAAALKKFHDQLKLAKAEGNEIQISDDILYPINEILRARQGNSTSFQPLLVKDIIYELDDEDGDVCSRVGVPVFNALLRLFLQTTNCPEVERGLYLLAATLYRDAHLSDLPLPEQEIEFVKSDIGKDILQPLLEFFTTANNSVELRRWAGILLLQLLQGSNENVERLEIGSEKSRRTLGTMLSMEPNDIIRIICGQLIKELVDAEVPRQDLWPTDTREEIYEGFPDSSQSGRWNQLFHTYLDKVDTAENPDTYLYFSQNVYTKPPFKLERPGHTTNIVTDLETLTIWSPASGTKFDQFLDIPLEYITTMTITTTHESQHPAGIAKIDFCINNDEDQYCFLNAAGAVLSQVTMALMTVDTKHMKMDLSKICPNLEIQEINSASQKASDVDNCEPGSHFSAHSSTVDTPVAFRGGEPEIIEPTISRSRKTICGTGKKVQEPTKAKQPLELDGSEYHSEPGEVEGQVSRHGDGHQRKKNNANSQPNSSRKKRVAAVTKPKAKKPLPTNQRICNANGKAPANAKLATGTEAETMESKAKIVKDVSKRGQPSDLTFEQKVEKLSQTFPSEKVEVLRGVLVVSDSNLCMATEQLRNGRQSDISSDEAAASGAKAGSSSRLGKVDNYFDSGSLTSPEGNDASTPKFTKPSAGKKIAASASNKSTGKSATHGQQTNKDLAQADSQAGSKPLKYSLKPKRPLFVAKSMKNSTKIQEKPKSVEKPKPVEKPKALEKPKIQEKPKPTKSDLYDISDDEKDAKGVAASKKSKKDVAKASNKPPAKEAPATTTKFTKLAKPDLKKRQPALGVFEPTAAASRSRRSAAIAASQKLHDASLSEDEIENAKEFVGVKKVQNTCKGKNAASQKIPQPVPKSKRHDGDPSMDEIDDDEQVIEAKKIENTWKGTGAPSQITVQLVSKAKPNDAKDVSAPSPENQDGSVDLQQADADDLGLLEDGPPEIATELELNHYGTSPQQPVKKPAQQTVNKPIDSRVGCSNGDSRSAEYFSTKLADILGDIDDGLLSGQSQKSKEKSKASGISDGSQMYDSNRLSDGYQKQKISESTGQTTNPLSFPKENIDPKHPDQKSVTASRNKIGFKDSAISNNGGMDDTIADLAQTHEDAGVSSGQESSADEVPIKNNVLNKKQTQQSQTTPHEPIGGDQVSGDSNVSTPAAPFNAKEKTLSDAVRKRKALDQMEPPPKRRGPQGDAIEVNKDPTGRRSQRVETQTKAATDALNNILSDKPLVDDHLTRKVQIVNFSAKGAMNQGASSVLRSSVNKDDIGQPGKTAGNPAGRKMKRTREDLKESNAGTQNLGRPLKRQSISPDDNHEGIQVNDENQLEYLSSPPLYQPQNQRPSKPSSQASRVDQNGSPMALNSGEKVDHISKVAQKLLQEDQQQAEDGKNERVQNSCQIFAPRPRLASIPKTRPSSPQNVEARYIKHQKIGNGLYEGIETKEVVAPEKSLPDPFVGGQAGKSSGFTDRLQAGASKETKRPETAHQPQKGNSIPVQPMEQTNVNAEPLPIYKASKTVKQERNRRLPQKSYRVPIYDDQTTLVNSETELPSSPTGLTSVSTIEDSRSPLSENANDAWNVALRPHYSNLSTLVHRLADEVIIRLVKEEDVMGLLVRQYREKGGKLLNHMTEKRDDEKASVAGNLEKQKKEMVGVYGDAKIFVNDSEKMLKSSSLLKFEKQWCKEQETIQRRIDEGRKAVQ